MLGIIVGLVVAIGGSAVLVFNTRTPDSKPSVAISAPAEQQTNFRYLKYQGQSGKTALALLKAKADVKTKDSAYGPYVDSINGVAGGTDGKYWAFYVNGQLAQVGADAYTTQNGDNVEWKLE